MVTQRRMGRLGAPGAAIVAGLAALPLAAVALGQPGQAAEVRQTAIPQAAVLRGRVTDAAGAPLADVRVRVAIPAADMRFVDSSTDHRRLEARSDAKGEYRMELPGVAERTTISIDAMKPGYRRLAGTLMAGGDARRVEVAPGTAAEAPLVLEPARYLSGIVLDGQGRPIPAVQIAANVESARASAGVERTASNADGSFELFNYPLEPFVLGGGPTKGVVHFSHPDYVDLKFDEVDALAPNLREALPIVLETGHKVTGTVLDVAGKPVPNATVKAALASGDRRKATLTDANGKFALRGLSGGPTTLGARALDIKQKIQITMPLDGDKEGLEVRLRAIALPADLERHTVLGMQLADVTPGLKSAYDLFQNRGALILDPGEGPDRLKIGRLAEGDTFWMVGETRIDGVREFVDQILAETAGRDADEYSVRVVYSFSRPDFEGTNTQYLKLTKADLGQLRAASERMK